ncbi:MAG: hypothetical protein JW741_16030 [Sedimentisphaerales bacterium]|nr:hypothetical protein [Sedimentisphaerales bacterium]
MRRVCLIGAIALMVAVGTSLVMANKATDGEGYCITISPNTLFLGSEDTIVTVHSNIPYGSVNTATLTLDDIPATFSKSDACGDLVVKFGRADVKGIVSPGIATLTLSGQFKDGSPFEASDSITVRE